MFRSVFFFLLTAIAFDAEARARRYGGGGLTGSAAWLVAAPIYWLIARYYLDKASHLFAAAGAIVVLMVITGPLGLYSGLIGVGAAYWIYYSFKLINRMGDNFALMRGIAGIAIVMATIAGAVYLVEHAAKLPKAW